MNSRYSKTLNSHRLLINLADKIDLKREYKYITLSNLSIYQTQKNMKKSCKNNKFKMSAPKWNEEHELSDESYSISDIQDYFEYTYKKHGENTSNPSIRININRIENRMTFRIKTKYYL